MNKVPQHLGIIMDGNRRWAKEKGLPVFRGHQRGVATLQKIVKYCRKRGIKTLTLFAFSTENWQRSQREVGFLMNLGKRALVQTLSEFARDNIKIKIIGQKERLPKGLQALVQEAEAKTARNHGMTLNIALSYGGRAEIASAIKNIVQKKIPSDKITERTIAENLWTSDLDLLIRTGKEQRLSNFLIWQAAYAELYFSPQYWPDFAEKDLERALEDFARRRRRMGQ